MTAGILNHARSCDVMSVDHAGSPCCCKSLLLILLVVLLLYSWQLMYVPRLMQAHLAAIVFNC